MGPAVGQNHDRLKVPNAGLDHDHLVTTGRNQAQAVYPAWNYAHFFEV